MQAGRLRDASSSPDVTDAVQVFRQLLLEGVVGESNIITFMFFRKFEILWKKR